MGIIHSSDLLPDVKIFRTSSLPITKKQSKFLTLTLRNTYQDIDQSRHQLPEKANWVPLEGGDHAQFGSKGNQSGHHPA